MAELTDIQETVQVPVQGGVSNLIAVPDPRRWLALAVIVVSQLLIVLDATVVNIALPTAQKALHISDANRQWALTAYALAFGGLLLLGGRIADYTGRKRAFIVGLLGFAGASALGGAAANAGMLFAARGLQGAFAALMAPAALSLLTVTFTEPKERARAFGVFGAVSGCGSAVGLLMSGLLTEYASWRWTLLVGAPIALGTAFAATRVLSESRVKGDTRYDLPGALTSTLGLVGLVYGFTKAQTDGWSSTTTIVWLLGAAVLLAVFVVIEVRSDSPLLPLRVILDRNRGGSYLAALLVGAGMFAVGLFLTYYLQTVMHLSPLMTGVSFLPFTATIIVAAGVASAVLPRVGPRFPMVAGLLFAVLGMVLFTRIGVDTGYWTRVLPAEIILGIGMGLLFVPMSSTALIGVAEQDAGVASALINSVQQIGGSLGTALLNTIAATVATGYIVAHAVTNPPSRQVIQAGMVHSFTVAFWVSAALIAFAAVTTVLLVRANKNQVSPAEDTLVAR
jgi:EmrB/QacA subfamily drug resistance transporter